jgi:hypothetical protein
MRLLHSFVCVCTIMFALATEVVDGAEVDSEWPCVAAIAGNDEIAEIHIVNLLALKGIDCRIDTLILGNISVPTPYAEKAREVLRQDAIEGGYYMIFPDGERLKARRGTVVELHQPISAVLDKEEFAASTAIGKWLRSPEMATTFRQYPFVKSLEIRERQYLIDKYTMDVGYDVYVDLRHDNSAGSASYSRHFHQVYGKGMSIVRPETSELNSSLPGDGARVLPNAKNSEKRIDTTQLTKSKKGSGAQLTCRPFERAHRLSPCILVQRYARGTVRGCGEGRAQGGVILKETRSPPD